MGRVRKGYNSGSKKSQRGGTMPTAVETKRVIVEFPKELLTRTEEAASERHTDRSKLIRSAVDRYLSELERLRLESELAEGYAANDPANRRICEEFAYVDAANL